MTDVDGVQVWGCGINCLSKHVCSGHLDDKSCWDCQSQCWCWDALTCGELDLENFGTGPCLMQSKSAQIHAQKMKKVYCCCIPSCTKWMHCHTQNKHWQSLLHNGAQGKCMRCVRRVSTAHSWFSFLSVVDASDADNEALSSKTEELKHSVNLSNGQWSSEASTIETSDE